MVTNGNGLGCLLMTAVVDPGFQERLLTEPAKVVSDFELTPDEQEALTSIRAGSFTEFAAELHRWLEQRDPFYLVFGRGNGSSGFQSEELFEDSEEAEERFAASRNGHHVGGMPDSRPLIEVSGAIQSYYGLDEEAEIALPLTT